MLLTATLNGSYDFRRSHGGLRHDFRSRGRGDARRGGYTVRWGLYAS